MACNLTTQKRRKHWQGLDAENAPCKAGTGYANNGSMAREYWIEFDTVQTHPSFLFLNSGLLMTFEAPTLPASVTGEWFYRTFLPLREVGLTVTGWNAVQNIGGVSFTVFQQLNVIYFDLVGGGNLWWEQASAIRTTPSIISTAVFGEFVQVSPSPGQPPNIKGGAVMTPLKACHDCT
ncbi:unnamed protein product [marine sediment metagenome]|uniref:Uncharacterized protein n=1 Tax=marine sediment metagenome TaxID=412755 RepID=X0ZNP1_9ZZZZ